MTNPTAQFRRGDVVRDGTHVGTVADVGTVLVQIETTAGASRMVCPWELVRLRASHDRHGSGPAPTSITNGRRGH